jgi:AraC family transcriptional regulator, transcriptional activator of pobA
MPLHTENIPFLKLQEQSLFLIRPLLPEVNPSVLKEAAHRHTYQEILWLTEGQGQHTIDDQLFPLEHNTFYLIYQGQVHHFIKGENLEGFLIRFNNEFLNEISPLERLTLPLFNKINLQNSEDITYFNTLITTTYKEFISTSPQKNAIVRHLLMVLLYKLTDIKQALQMAIVQNSEADDVVFLRFTTILEQKFTEQVDTQHFATELSISSRQLCNIVKQHSGRTTKQLIIDRRILEAKRLLAYTQNSLKEIAYQLGFDDTAYFCRTFKTQTGFTPTEFKSKTKSEQKVQ